MSLYFLLFRQGVPTKNLIALEIIDAQRSRW